MEATKIHLLGRDHTVVLPAFVEREELMLAFVEAQGRGGLTRLRVLSATLGLCTRIGRESGVDYPACKCDVLAYGGKVYGWLREKGVTPVDIATVATPLILQVVDATHPREVEVETREGFTEAGGGPTT